VSAGDETYNNYQYKTEEQKKEILGNVYNTMYNNREIPKNTLNKDDLNYLKINT
jgi:hypothetical protein